MKKFLSFILVLMLFSNVCYAYDTNTEVEILEKYNIFTGDENGYRLEDNITKGEFVKMLAVASLYVDLTKQADFSVDSEGNKTSNLKVYDDLKETDWEYPYFLFLDTLGFDVITGNLSNAKDSVTYLECYRYIVKALGYEISDDMIQNAIKATELGVTKGLAVEIHTPCTRENAVKMISNALNIPLCALKSYNAENGEKEYTVLDGKDGRELRTLKTNLDRINQ